MFFINLLVYILSQYSLVLDILQILLFLFPRSFLFLIGTIRFLMCRFSILFYHLKKIICSLLLF